MGLFKHTKDEEAKIQLERESLDKLNSKDVELFDIPGASGENNTNDSEWQISGKIRAPHTITAEELNAHSHKNDVITDEIPAYKPNEANNSPTDFLYQKMMHSRTQILSNTIQSEIPEVANNQEADEEIIIKIPEKEEYTPLDIEAAIADIKITANLTNVITEAPEPSLDSNEEPEKIIEQEEITIDNSDATDTSNKAEVLNEIPDLGGSPEERRATLLARCNAYLQDGSDNVKIDTEKYKLESVESILKDFEARAAEKANKIYTTNTNIQLPHSNKPNTSFKADPNDVTPSASSDTIVFKTPETTVATKKIDVAHPTTDPTLVKHIFSANTPTPPVNQPTPPTAFEDISSTRIITDINSSSKPQENIASTKTSVFPVVESVSDTSTSNEAEVDEITSMQKEEKIDFDDYKSISDRSKILNSLLNKKKSFTFKFLLSLFVFIPSLLLSTIAIFNSSTIPKRTIDIAELIFCILILLINANTLAGLKDLFNTKTKTNLPAALSLISATIFAVINLIFSGDLVGFSCMATLSLVSYNLANRNFYSKTIKNFNIIANAEFKNAISIIQNKNATKTIVGNSIEGSALVCYGGETTNIHNFLRYTFCKNPISGKIQKLSLISVVVGVLLSLSTIVLNSSDLIFALYIFCASICFSAIPAVYHIVSLTINSANKRLNHYDAMITGYKAADELELCNAVAVDCGSLFPEGSVRLVDMKLLSPNPFDQSILDAAAITSTIQSPLAGIFKQMDSTKDYEAQSQEVDTVIYEEKMGISGWVNDRRVFVGNRDLLIAHGFAGLPPAELDKKIMRKGYFPVYIASDNILCALLVVKYDPDQDIIYEMQRLANTGTTILVNNCDPNLCSQMLADYFGLYDETVFIMNKKGTDFHKALTTHKEHRRAGAAFKSRIEGLIASLTASINIKKYISRMSVFYICSVILGFLTLITCIFTSLNNLITPLNMLLIQLFFTFVTLLPAILRKP